MNLLVLSSTSSPVSRVPTSALLLTNATRAIHSEAANQTASAEDDGASAKRAIHGIGTAGDRGSMFSAHHDVGEALDGSGDRSGASFRQYLPYGICGSLFTIAAIAALLAYVLIRRRRKARAKSASTSPQQHRPILGDNPKISEHLTPTPQQVSAPILVTVPDLDASNRSMPPTTVHTADTCNGDMVQKCPMAMETNSSGKSQIISDTPLLLENCSMTAPQFVRIKTKCGLLERRGSNASLTIAINPVVVDSFHLPTPPKECSVLEYLSSAGNRMSRRQLIACLKNTKALHDEFLDIPLNHARKLDIPGCNNKNRYKSIWPNEETRVMLPRRSSWCRTLSNTKRNSIPGDQKPVFAKYDIDDQNNVIAPQPTKFPFYEARYGAEDQMDDQRVPSIPGVDMEIDQEDMSATYINANHVKGYCSESAAFIAAQGPLPNTVNDFWTMVWHERCPCIVMMTQLHESDRVKCENYLPDIDAQYGDISVVVKCVAVRSGYSVRDLILKRDNEQRRIKHFWFTAWPDHKAPSSTAKQLIDLVHDVETERYRHRRCQDSALNGPVLVHCSAGLGRTGCFIATSVGMKQLREENAVDILGIVCQLRMDRGGMIQTVEQYEFIHHALVHYERYLPETPAPTLTPLSANSINKFMQS